MDGRTRFRIYDITRISVFLALIVISSFIKLPITIIPISLQFATVLITCIVLPNFQSVTTVALYILLGLVGVPVFTQGAGLTYIFHVHFGYLLGLLVMSFVISFLKKYDNGKKNIWKLAVIGYIVLYSVALSYICLLMQFYTPTNIQFSTFIRSYQLLFLPSDVVSIILAVCVSKRLLRNQNKGKQIMK